MFCGELYSVCLLDLSLCSFYVYPNMSKSTTMLRTRRKDNNVKPNRRESRPSRLDRKSSRGMIYENEELRLRTININAEIERGQYDIKKLKRENEMLKKEIWCLRDEYDKLDKLLKDKEYDFSSSSTTCSTSDSESCSSCTEESDQVETSQNLQNVQKTNMKNLHSEFDHLSVVPEETTTETSERTSQPNDEWGCDHILPPDQSYPPFTKAHTLPVPPPKNFFSPLKTSKSCSFYQNLTLPDTPKDSPDLLVKTDNCAFNGTSSRSTFSTGGNLEELLNDIETISQDILKISTHEPETDNTNVTNVKPTEKPYKSELNVVLMPNPMPLLGFEKYKQIQRSFDSLHSIEDAGLPTTPVPPPPSLFYFGPSPSKEVTSSDLISSENEENLKFQTSKLEATPEPPQKSPKLSIRRKVSIHFKGKKEKTPGDKKHSSIFDFKQKTPSVDSKKSTTETEPKTPSSSESKKKPLRKSSSASPDRKHVHVKDDKKHKHRKDRRKSRRGTITSIERMNRERSFSVCTDRSNLEHRFEDYGGQSERERTNSLSSCETVKTRKMSSISNIPLNGKVPWCGCWGNGCI